MAVLKKEELIEEIKKLFSDNPTDEQISLLENFTDTYDSFSAKDSDDISAKLEEAEKKNAEWEQKYNDNDAMWRKKYIDRFNGKVEDIPEVKKNLDADRSSNITIDDLFTINN